MKNIKVLGADGCKTCTNLKEKIAKMIESRGIEATVEKVNDIIKIMNYGVMSTPAVVVDEEVKCSGRLPSEKELEEWIKS